MADYLEFRSGTDHNGYRASAFRPTTGQNVPVVIAPALTASNALGGQAINLATIMEETTRHFIDATNRFSHQGFKDWIKPDIFRPIGQAYRGYREAAIARRNELNAMHADWATPRFAKDDNRAPMRAELRSRIAAMKPAQGVEASMRNFDMATAMAEGGEAMALAIGWTPDLWARFIDGYAERNLATRLAPQYPLKPSVTDPLRDGPDHEAATRVASEHVAARRSHLDEISGVEALLGSVVDFTAITMDADRGTAFNALIAA